MQNMQKLITQAGGLAAVQAKYLSIENPPYMRLVVEVVGGPHPNGAYEVSVAHYGEQNGDAMRDPEILFHVLPHAAEWLWTPIWIQQDYLGSFDQCAEIKAHGILHVNRAGLEASIQSFARTWNRNLKQQGFLEAAAAQTLTA